MHVATVAGILLLMARGNVEDADSELATGEITEESERVQETQAGFKCISARMCQVSEHC